MPGQEIDADQALADIETDAEREQREQLEAQIKAKVEVLDREQRERLAQNQAIGDLLLAAEERRRWAKEHPEAFKPDPKTERISEATALVAKALDWIDLHDLHDLHGRLEEKLKDLHGVREQRAEQARFVRQVSLNLETAKLDALAEMESQESYVPGRNEEQRRRQRDSWLVEHHGHQAVLRALHSAEDLAENLELAEHRIQGELSSLKTLISIRTTELNLISSFVGR